MTKTTTGKPGFKPENRGQVEGQDGAKTGPRRGQVRAKTGPRRGQDGATK
jgi:hypothetical protein